MQAYLERINRYNPAYNAIVSFRDKLIRIAQADDGVVHGVVSINALEIGLHDFAATDMSLPNCCGQD